MIELKETFSTTVILEDIMIPNTWEITINLIPNNKHAKLYNRAVERVQYYIQEIMDNSILASYTKIAKLTEMPFTAQVHLLPDDPWDHLVAMCLFTKVNAICEDVFFVDNVVVSSTQARGVSHNFGSEDGGNENLHVLFDEEDAKTTVGYWYKSEPQMFTLEENRLVLNEHSWREIGEDLAYEEKPDGTVVSLKDFKRPRNDDDNTA